MIINGTQENVEAGITISELLHKFDVNPEKIVVEVNLEIIPKDQFDTKVLKEEDKIELVSFVGGG